MPGEWTAVWSISQAELPEGHFREIEVVSLARLNTFMKSMDIFI